MLSSFSLVAKKKHIRYPFSIEEPLYLAANEECLSEGIKFSQYIRKLIYLDLKAKGKLPPKESKD